MHLGCCPEEKNLADPFHYLICSFQQPVLSARMLANLLTNNQLCDSLWLNLTKEEAENHGTGLLRKVQEQGRDQESPESHSKEQEARYKRHMPQVWDKGI